MILTTIYRVFYPRDEYAEMLEFDKTAEANGYIMIKEDINGRTYEFRKDYVVDAERKKNEAEGL